LVAALHQLAVRYGSEGEQPRVLVEASEDIPHLPAVIEVAVYRITQEALTNVARHAQAKTCVARLAVNEDVTLDNSDDGVGIPGERTTGVGPPRCTSAWLGLVKDALSAPSQRAVLECWCAFPYRRSEKLDTLRILVA